MPDAGMIKLYFTILCLMSLAACVTPNYQDHSGRNQSTKPDRATDIHFKLSSVFHQDPPTCAIVLPTGEAPNAKASIQISQAFARHLRGRMDRVIFPNEAMSLARKLALDLETEQDRRRLAFKSRCAHFALSSVYEYGEDYAVIAAQKKIGIKAELHRQDTEIPVWQATNTAWRGNGGVPLSPISAIASITKAAIFNQDHEIIDSLTDDVFRRLVKTIPDTRSY
jgi:hypothetical protein